MTADERIESLVSSFGQTIADLPKADGMHHVYEDEHRKSAKIAVRTWHKVDPADLIDIVDLLDMHASYICHLCDVIDRMEAALETARRWMGCEMCGRSGSCQKVTDYEVDNGFIRDCDDFRIKDWFLEGV